MIYVSLFFKKIITLSAFFTHTLGNVKSKELCCLFLLQDNFKFAVLTQFKHFLVFKTFYIKPVMLWL